MHLELHQFYAKQLHVFVITGQSYTICSQYVWQSFAFTHSQDIRVFGSVIIAICMIHKNSVKRLKAYEDILVLATSMSIMKSLT